MPIFDNFTITLNPNNLGNLSQQLDASSRPNNTDPYSPDITQSQAAVDSINLIQQAALIENPSLAQTIIKQGQARDIYLDMEGEERSLINSIGSIYGKVDAISNNRIDEIATKYQDQSKVDAQRFHKATLQIDGKAIPEDNLVGDAVTQYNATYSTNKQNDEVTMDMIVDYIQTKHQVSISDQQRNFLCSQWNQAGLQGSAYSLINSGIRDKEGYIIPMSGPKTESLIFNNGQLHSIKYTQTLENKLGQSDGKSAESSVTADISNLASATASPSKKERSADEYLPKHSPKSVSINYSSANGLDCTINPDVHNALKTHAEFQTQSRFAKLFTKIKQAFTSTKDSILSRVKSFISNLSFKNQYQPIPVAEPIIEAIATAIPTKKSVEVISDNYKSSIEPINISGSIDGKQVKWDKNKSPEENKKRISPPTKSKEELKELFAQRKVPTSTPLNPKKENHIGRGQ